MRGFRLAPILMAAVVCFLGQLALAAQSATVDVDQLEIYDGPGKQYHVIDHLSKGMGVSASNLPTQGFYKIRTGTGQLGWVAADSLVLHPPGAADADALPAAYPDDEPGPRVAAPARSMPRENAARSPLHIDALWGLDFYSMNDVNKLVGFSALANGNHLGGIIGYTFDPTWTAELRADWIYQQIIAQDQTTKNTFQMNTTAIPIMAGIDWAPVRFKSLTFHLALDLGLSVVTDLNSTALNLSSPNVTDLTSLAFAGMLNLRVDWNVWKIFSLFVEGGYRYLQTGSLTPNTASSANGAGVFQVNNAFSPVTLNLSGPFADGGVGVSF